MGDYTLTCRIDQNSVRELNGGGFRLCFAAGVSSPSNIRYSVVAYSTDVSPSVNITWSEQYAIAATKDGFSNDAQMSVNTTLTSIQFGQTYTLPADFSDGHVDDNPVAPANGFQFKNDASQAAAVVYKMINGRLVPIYVNPSAPLPRGIENLIPKVTAALWFQNGIQDGSMISDFKGASLQLDLSSNASRNAVVSFSDGGNWTVMSNN